MCAALGGRCGGVGRAAAAAAAAARTPSRAAAPRSTARGRPCAARAPAAAPSFSFGGSAAPRPPLCGALPRSGLVKRRRGDVAQGAARCCVARHVALRQICAFFSRLARLLRFRSNCRLCTEIGRGRRTADSASTSQLCRHQAALGWLLLDGAVVLRRAGHCPD